MEQSMVTVSNLRAGYGMAEMVKGISLEVKKGEILCIVGESGSGKSTLIKTLMGLKETRVSVFDGSIQLDGKELLTLSDKERAAYLGSTIGMIFQNPTAFFNPVRKYKKQFKETLRCHGKYNRETFAQQTKEVFLKLHLHDYERIFNSCPCELSGGMNQRITIAMIMLLEPKLLLADEPTSALDVSVERQVIEELLKLRDECGTSIILVTHSMNVARKMADKIAIMYNGQIVEKGNAKEILENPKHDYTKTLLMAEPKFDDEILASLRKLFPNQEKQDKGQILCDLCDHCTGEFKEGKCNAKKFNT